MFNYVIVTREFLKETEVLSVNSLRLKKKHLINNIIYDLLWFWMIEHNEAEVNRNWVTSQMFVGFCVRFE